MMFVYVCFYSLFFWMILFGKRISEARIWTKFNITFLKEMEFEWNEGDFLMGKKGKLLRAFDKEAEGPKWRGRQGSSVSL